MEETIASAPSIGRILARKKTGEAQMMTEQAVETKPGKRVLVVDDEQDFLSIMDFFLTMEGFEVETALDGADAIRSINKTPPDLILLDVVMPVLDGYGTLKALQGRRKTRNIPVIMLSILEKSPEETSTLSITDYLVKPFSADTLIRKVRETLAA